MTTPISTLGSAAPDTSRLPTRDNLRQASQQFESLFVSMMLKSMRSAQDALGQGLFDSDAGRQFRDMQDQKLAADFGGRGTLGIAKAMEDYLSRGRPDLKAEEPKP